MFIDFYGYETTLKMIIQSEIQNLGHKDKELLCNFIQFNYKGKECFVSLGGNLWYKTYNAKNVLRMRMRKKDNFKILLKCLDSLLKKEYKVFSVNK